MHRLTFYLKFSRQRNIKCLAWRADWVAMTASPLNHSRLQHAHSYETMSTSWRTELKCWFNFDSVPFMYAIPHWCHTQIAITSNITDHSEPSVLGLWYSRLRRPVWRQTAQKCLNDPETSWNHKSQTGPRASETCLPSELTWLHRGFGWMSKDAPLQLFQCSCSLAFLYFSETKARFCSYPQSSTNSLNSPTMRIFLAVLFHEPSTCPWSCLRKAVEDGTSVGNTGNENEGMAWGTS